MSRCKACNSELTDVELAQDNPHTGEPEDLCMVCQGHVWDAVLEKEEEDDAVTITHEEIDLLMEELNTYD
jgi:hypothetical protein